jgi:hypothetical protein
MPIWGTLGRPAAPKDGDFGYNFDTSHLEVWDSTAWVPMPKITVSDTAPASPVVGELWVDTT